ncbi:conserved hypothetical protein [Ferroglobus placidus DSM 10642]|uniref:Uncharacterized protein n=1 Tax=Ferroglobus placidus (strain DSM 10642 / AEDII12DO) TaxID=589924 RepID=D3RZI6_FERPA|nr:hypothetical protein [Ferroglobus placidus]ADC65899.1 conserved hypothetical protein [Ferroglobus placidus DSM 10642]
MKVIITDQPCGYKSEVIAKKIDKSVKIEIISECEDVRKFGEELPILSAKDVLTRIPENIVYKKANLKHSTCIIPWVVLKAAEIELGLNVKRLPRIKFEDDF